jgi:hypothetical protein
LGVNSDRCGRRFGSVRHGVRLHGGGE